MSSNTRGIESNNFDSDYSTTTNNSKFTTVPVNGSEVLLTQDTEPTSNTTIYYGVLANRDIPAGSYSNTVLYTALAEQPSEIRVSSTNASTSVVSSNPANIDISSTISLHSPITIYTSINTASDSLGTASVVFKDSSNNAAGTVENTDCLNPEVNKDAENYIYITCTSPAMPVGAYDVEVTLDTFGRVLTQANAVQYTGTPMIQNITTMQQMSTDICKTATIGYTRSLQDPRGSYNTTTPANYGIIKAKDNNCWMTDNLNLYNRTVTSADTDIPSNATFSIPETSNYYVSTSSIPDTAFVHRTYNVSSTTPSYNNVVKYNWCSTVALSSTCSTTQQQDRSICPKSWMLPANTIYQNLLNTYDISATSQLLNERTLGYNYYGIYGWNSDTTMADWYWNGDSRFWTSSPNQSDNKQVISLLYWSNDRILVGADNKNNGELIRCVAR